MDSDGLFDFEALDAREDKDLRGKPRRYVFAGQECLVAQRRLPNENRPEDTGSEVWPASLALARFLEREALREDMGKLAAYMGKAAPVAMRRSRASPQGRGVLELGAGLGLVGLAARALGAQRVFLSDVAAALPWLRHNVDLNGRVGTCEVLELDWRHPERCGLSADAVELVCCSDCVLWPELFEPLVATLERFLGQNSVALLSIVFRCAQVRDFFVVLEGRLQLEEVWASPAELDIEPGRVRIYRAWKHLSSYGRDAWEPVSEDARNPGEVLTTAELVRVLGVPEGSISSFGVGAKGFRRGVHSVTCHLQLSSHCNAQSPQNEAALPSSVFVKRVAPFCGEKVEKPSRWRAANSDMGWAQDAATYQVEINWFDHFNETLRSRGVRLPRCYRAWSEGATEVGALVGSASSQSTRTAAWAAAVSSHFVSVLEDLAEPTWAQHLLLSEPQLRAALGLLADLHGAAMGDDELLEEARELLHEQGTYWSPVHRQPGELELLEPLWAHFVTAFRHLDVELFSRPEVQQLGTRLLAAQVEVDEGLRGASSQGVRGRTVLHGDFRTANLFFGPGLEVVPVHFGWSGLGFGAQDVAYLLISSAELEVLSERKALKRLISSAYLKPLRQQVSSFACPSEAEFFSVFRLACLDYAKVVWSYHLARKDPEWLQAANLSIGWCAHNRSLGHALGLVRFVCRLLEGVEVPGFAD